MALGRRPVAPAPVPDRPAARPGSTVVASYVSLDRGVRVRRRACPRRCSQARLYPPAPARGQAGLLLLPDVQAPRRPSTTGTRLRLRGAQGAHDRPRHGRAATFAGRILQLITGSTGLDDCEWGVTLFGVHPDDLKDCVYTMRFDEASARYAEFGPFYTGMVGAARDVLAAADRRAVDDVSGLPWRLEACATSCATSAGWWWPSAAAPTRPPGQGGHRHPRAGPGCSAPPRLALAGPRGADDCRALAAEWGLRWVGVPTDELADPAYAANDGRPLLPLQDLPDGGARPRWPQAESATRGPRGQPRRPGRPPARARPPRPRRGALFPLVEAGFTKADVRHWSRQLGLRTWDKPAAACLASRVPYGTPVTLGSPARRSTGPSRALGARVRPAAGAPLRRHGPDRGASRRSSTRCWPAEAR